MIQSDGGRALMFPTDLARPGEVMRLAKKVEARLGAVDLVINDAGRLCSLGPPSKTDPKSWWGDITVDLYGVFLTCRTFLTRMIERDRGRIVNVLSHDSASPGPLASSYTSSQAGVMRFT